MRQIRFIERKSNRSILFKVIAGFFLISELSAIVLVFSLSRIYSRYLRSLSVSNQIDLSGISTAINQQFRDGLIVTTAIAVVMTLVCYLFLRYQFKIMFEITDMVSSIFEGNRSKLVSTDKHEFGALAIAINQLVDQLKSLEQANFNSEHLQQQHNDPVSDMWERYIAANSEGFMFVDAHNVISKINVNFAEILSISVDEAMGRDSSDILPPEVMNLLISMRSQEQEVAKLRVQFPYSETYMFSLIKVYDREKRHASVHLPPSLVSDTPILLGTIIVAVSEVNAQTYETSIQYRREVSQKLRVPMTSLLSFLKITKQKLEETILPKLVTPDEKTKRAISQVSHNLDVMLVEGLQIAQSIGEVLQEGISAEGITRQRQNAQDSYRQLAIASFLDQMKLEATNLLSPNGTQLFFEVNIGQAFLQANSPDVETDLRYVIKNLLSRLVRGSNFRKLVFYARMADANQNRIAFSHQGAVVIVIGAVNPQFSRSQIVSLIQKLKTPPHPAEVSINKGSGLTIIQSILDQYDGSIFAEAIDSHRETCQFYTLTLPIKLPSNIPVERH
ncbi:MAG: hypothetical protein NW214_12445 [Pseudanabaenaceae cyanobacterium bins.39]|nr:hypothetical protein [Pseudanabaenaceae cyanobacterium bins.39]